MPVTSTDKQTGADPFLTATPGDVERGIVRELLKRGFAEDDPELISAVMTVTGPVLEAKDDEITRLRRVLKSAGSAAENAVGKRVEVIELSARASERVRCAAYLDHNGFPDAAGLLAMRAGGPAVDASQP